MNSKILVATHKQYNFPKNDLYIPIHVGKVLSKRDFGYLGDESGESISTKNRNFCELTALYWAWKNDYFNKYNYCGLVHYRRYFEGDLTFEKFNILSSEKINDLMITYDLLLPKKRKYYIETIENHYCNAHNRSDLVIIRKIIQEKYPNFTDSFDLLMKKRELYLFNMFVMKKELFEEYMEWLFDILFELENRVDISSYDNYQSRIFGFISERLFNVWILQKKLKVKELKVVNLEGENLLPKAYGLLKRKFLK